MGDGADYFGLKGGPTGSSKPTRVPWAVLDKLFPLNSAFRELRDGKDFFHVTLLHSFFYKNKVYKNTEP